MRRFDEVYRHSLKDPQAFWTEAAAEIDWVEPWERVLDDSRAPFYRWFAGGRLNTCHNALDRLETGETGHFVITRRNKPRAVLVALERYEELLREQRAA